MKLLKRISSGFISLLLVLTLVSPAYAESFINVTLRVETMDKTIYPKTEVKIEKKDNITLQDVLEAAGLQYENNDWGNVGKINGVEDWWSYAINNDSTIYPPVIKDGDNIVYFLYDYAQGHYLFFEKEDYQTTVDQSLKVSLKGEGYDENYNHKEINISDAEILYRAVGEDNYKSTHQSTDENGNVTLDFDKKGTYEITALSHGSSRPYAKIEVKGEETNPYEAINKTIASLDIPSETDSNITLPTSNDDWSQAILWTSSNPDIISEEGIINRGQENQTVTLTATVSDGKLSKKVSFKVTVLADNSKYEAGELKEKKVIWSSSDNNQAITNKETPLTASETNLKWVNSKVNATSSPIIVKDKIYVTNNKNQLVRLNKDGKIEKEVNLSSSLYYVPDLCYGGGMIYVPLSNGTIQAFNEDNLSSLWISEKVNGSVVSKLTYHNGYVYAGTYGSAKGNQFFAINTKDEDPTKGNETKAVTWKYNAQGRDGYYCSQSKVINNNIYFVGDDGQLVSHDLTSQKVNKTLSLDAGVRGGITFDGNDLYVITKSSTLYKISTDLKVINKVKLEKEGSSTSTPTIYNGKIYVGGNQVEVSDKNYLSAKGFVAVVDAKTMKVISKADTVANVQSTPLVTTAYANKGNKNAVNVYFTCNNYPGGVYSFTDYQGNTKIDVKELYQPASQYQNYNMNSVCVDENGTLYFVNDSKALFALENTNINASIVVKDTAQNNEDEKEQNTNDNQQDTQKKDETNQKVETGDNTNITMYVVIGVIAVVVLAVLCLPKFRKKK